MRPHLWRAIGTCGLLCALLLGFLPGCKSWGEVTTVSAHPDDPNSVQVPYADQLLFAKRAEALGLKGRLHLHGGPMIFGPFVLSLGVNWDADLTIDPADNLPPAGLEELIAAAVEKALAAHDASSSPPTPGAPPPLAPHDQKPQTANGAPGEN
ncbi:MAG: hypothetical protein PHU85_00380 [Phycisphaerae bacterium]|nr:hypothetical protein [Phycisphaerae bacterium]